MEAILLFLGKAIASGVVGHYLKKSLESLDKTLAESIEKGDVTAAGAFVRAHGLESQISHVAEQALSNALIFPLSAPFAPTTVDEAKLFADLIQIGFTVARAINVDLLLPGSLIGPETYSLFCPNNAEHCEITLDDVSIQLPKSPCELYFLPAQQTGWFAKPWWTQYTDAIIDERHNSTTKYLAVNTAFQFLRDAREEYRVTHLTAGICEFAYAAIMPQPKQSAIGASHGRVSLTHWYAGVKKMIEGLDEIRDMPFIRAEEWNHVIDAATLVSDLKAKSEASG